jgi:hypothetical protein
MRSRRAPCQQFDQPPQTARSEPHRPDGPGTAITASSPARFPACTLSHPTASEKPCKPHPDPLEALVRVFAPCRGSICIDDPASGRERSFGRSRPQSQGPATVRTVAFAWNGRSCRPRHRAAGREARPCWINRARSTCGFTVIRFVTVHWTCPRSVTTPFRTSASTVSGMTVIQRKRCANAAAIAESSIDRADELRRFPPAPALAPRGDVWRRTASPRRRAPAPD